MSVREEWLIRGYRPGRYGMPLEEDEEQAEIVRLANVEIYAKRANAGLPIFRDADNSGSVVSGDGAGSAAM